jgi:hypothetical protein
MELSKPAEVGQVWEGEDGWVVLVLVADHSVDVSPWLVHTVVTIVSPVDTPTALGTKTALVEDVAKGGMAAAGWKRLF